MKEVTCRRYDRNCIHHHRGDVSLNKETDDGPLFRRFVTFYFTNFLPQLSNFYLQKGFEVCGMLKEVVVPSKCNAYGGFMVS